MQYAIFHNINISQYQYYAISILHSINITQYQYFTISIFRKLQLIAISVILLQVGPAKGGGGMSLHSDLWTSMIEKYSNGK